MRPLLLQCVRYIDEGRGQSIQASSPKQLLQNVISGIFLSSMVVGWPNQNIHLMNSYVEM
jgi:hypothetical protein